MPVWKVSKQILIRRKIIIIIIIIIIFFNNNNDNNNNNNKPVFNCCKVESRLAEKQIGAKYLEV